MQTDVRWWILYENDQKSEIFRSHVVRNSLMGVMIASTFCQDVVHCLVVSNYCIECQLLMSYVNSISERVVEKSLSLEVAMKVINGTLTKFMIVTIISSSIHFAGNARLWKISSVLKWKCFPSHWFAVARFFDANPSNGADSYPARIFVLQNRCAFFRYSYATDSMGVCLCSSTCFRNVSIHFFLNFFKIVSVLIPKFLLF